jgi:hypothetical protein
VIAVDRQRSAVLCVVSCLVLWASTAQADWKACQSKPTRGCVLEEALRGEGGPLAGKDRLDVVVRAGAYRHVEYAGAADIDEALRQAKSAPNGYTYASIAIHGLVAANQKQQAVDFVASYRGPLLNAIFIELTRSLAKAGDVDTAAALLDRIAPTLDAATRTRLGQTRAIESVKALAEAGKTDDALPAMISVLADVPVSDLAEMEMAVGAAYAERGGTAIAQRYFDLAGRALEKAGLSAYGSGAESLRFASISLAALRGDTEAVRTALQPLQLPAEGAAADRLVVFQRAQGFQRVVSALLKAKQFAFALEVAKSAPGYARDSGLAAVAVVAASNGRIDDARAALGSFGDKADPNLRGMSASNLAAALVKAGKLAPAIEMAEKVGDPVSRKAVLFAIAQAMPQ